MKARIITAAVVVCLLLLPIPAPTMTAAATACDVFISHMELSERLDVPTAEAIADAWLHSGNPDLYKAAFVLFDGTPSVADAWPYISAGCAA